MAGNTQFLLDTNILLSALIAPDTLPVEIQTQLSDPANSILFSVASIWEIAIKRSLGREDFNFRPEDIQQLALETGFTELPIISNHCHRITDLPWHHRDPFDRLLVSQAQSIPAYLLTTDELRKPPIRPPTATNLGYASLPLFQGDERWRHGKEQTIGRRRLKPGVKAG